MCDGDRHQNEQRRTAFPIELHPGPADEAQRGQEDDDQHHDDRHGSPDRAEQDYGNEQHRHEREGREDAHVVVDRVAHGAIEDDFTGQVVIDVRMFRPGRGERFVEEIDDFHARRLPILGKRNADDQPGDLTVARNQAPGNFLGFKRDFFDTSYVAGAEGTGAVDQPFDNKFVLTALAVRIVCDRIDTGDIGRMPELFGQIFYGDKRFACENCAVARRYGNERGIRKSVGVFKLFERQQCAGRFCRNDFERRRRRLR